MPHRKDHAIRPKHRPPHQRPQHARQNQLAPYHTQEKEAASQRLAAHPMPLRRTPATPTPRHHNRPRRIRKDSHHLLSPNATIHLARHRRQIRTDIRTAQLTQRQKDHRLPRCGCPQRLAAENLHLPAPRHPHLPPP